MNKITLSLLLPALALLTACNSGGTSPASQPTTSISPTPSPTVSASPSPSPSTDPTPTPTATPINLLESYVNLLSYQPAAGTSLTEENLSQSQLSMTVTQALELNQIAIDYYNDSSCINLNYQQKITGSATMSSGQYSTNTIANLAVCEMYNNNNQKGCVYAYNNTHSMKFTVTTRENLQLGGLCLTNPKWSGERFGYYNISSNWSRNCTSNYNCGFSQNYKMQLN